MCNIYMEWNSNNTYLKTNLLQYKIIEMLQLAVV